MSDSQPDSATAKSATSELTASIWRELDSLKTPSVKHVAEAPKVGSKAPSSPKLELSTGKPVLILFLRHCGCPFAEKTFKTLTKLSTKHDNISFVAVSHSSAEATERWIPQVGGVWNVRVVVDEERDIYAEWGMGLSSTWQLANPQVLYSAYRLGQDEGLWNRPTESGSRWQKGGAFAVDKYGIIRWSHVAGSANDIPDLKAALESLTSSSSK